MGTFETRITEYAALMLVTTAATIDTFPRFTSLRARELAVLAGVRLSAIEMGDWPQPNGLWKA